MGATAWRFSKNRGAESTFRPCQERASLGGRSRLEAPILIGRGSSVVERTLGKGEVESSILSRGTSTARYRLPDA